MSESNRPPAYEPTAEEIAAAAVSLNDRLPAGDPRIPPSEELARAVLLAAQEVRDAG